MKKGNKIKKIKKNELSVVTVLNKKEKKKKRKKKVLYLLHYISKQKFSVQKKVILLPTIYTHNRCNNTTCYLYTSRTIHGI